jgi:predicted transglutaminase-like cysteine proteinase
MFGLNNKQLDSYYLSSLFSYEINSENSKIKLSYYLNNEYSFNITKPKLIPDEFKDHILIFSDKSNLLHDSYSFEKLASLNYSYRIKAFSVKLNSDFIKEDENFSSLRIYKSDIAVAFIDSKVTEQKRYSLNNAFELNVHKDRFRFGIGASSLPIYFGEEQHYFLASKKNVLLNVAFQAKNYSYALQLSDWLSTAKLSRDNYLLQIDYLSKTKTTNFAFTYDYKVNERLDLSFLVSKTFGLDESAQEIYEQRSHLLLSNHIQKNTVKVQFSYQLKRNLNYELFDIQTSKKLFLSNKEKTALVSAFIGNLDEGLKYQLRIKAGTIEKRSLLKKGRKNELLELAVFLDQDDIQLEQNSKKVNYDVYLESDGQSEKIHSSSFQVFNRNIWDGNVQHLKNFISIEELSNSLLKTLKKIQFSRNSLSSFKEVLSTISKGIHYRRDPIYSYDQIKSANDLFRSKYGDCEDLVVYYASCLKYLGIESKLIPIAAEGDEEAHLLLLIDSSIDSIEMENLAFHEFNSVVLKNRQGRQSIWLPIELSELENGFDRAYEMGIKQLNRFKTQSKNSNFIRLE